MHEERGSRASLENVIAELGVRRNHSRGRGITESAAFQVCKRLCSHMRTSRPGQPLGKFAGRMPKARVGCKLGGNREEQAPRTARGSDEEQRTRGDCKGREVATVTRGRRGAEDRRAGGGGGPDASAEGGRSSRATDRFELTGLARYGRVYEGYRRV